MKFVMLPLVPFFLCPTRSREFNLIASRISPGQGWWWRVAVLAGRLEEARQEGQGSRGRRVKGAGAGGPIFAFFDISNRRFHMGFAQKRVEQEPSNRRFRMGFAKKG